jgi:hypothetical protein
MIGTANREGRPVMSTNVEDVLREAQKLTPEERRQLADALLNDDKPRSAVSGYEKGSGADPEIRSRRMEWLKAHRAELGGQHLALDGVALVATGRSYREARENALSAGKSDVFITYLPRPDEVAEIGGW